MLVLENGKYIVANECLTPSLPETVTSYEEKVVSLIRQRYSLDEELAIQRQRDIKPEEFGEYFTYCELCKEQARNN